MNKFCLFICFFSLLSISKCFAQLLTNNNVSITISSSAQITVKGSVQNNAGTVINNSGTIDLSGDWVNNAANSIFGTSAGTVILNGNGQNISGTSSTIFNNLRLQGNGVKTLQVSTNAGGGYPSPSGVLDLGSQKLDLNSKTLTILNPSPTAITRTSGFIQSETDPVSGYGIIQWDAGTGAPGSLYEFPFGNIASGDYLPLSFSVTTAGSGNGSIQASTYPTNTFLSPNNRPLPTGLPSIVNVAGVENADRVLDRWWLINTLNYTTEPVSDLMFTYRDIEWNTGNNTLGEVQLRAQRNDGFTWTAQPLGNVNTLMNQVTLTGVQQYNSYWALVDNDAPLPITLLYFDATLNKSGTVDIRWITESEINNDYFTVERSSNGVDFETLEIIRGAGNSTVTRNYATIDPHPLDGLSYYRLKQTDYDGRFSYSALDRVMNVRGGFPDVHIYPNPANEFFLISLSTPPAHIEDLCYELFDYAGRKVMDSEQYPTSAISPEAVRLELHGLASGVYFLQLMMEGERVYFGRMMVR